MTTYTAIADSEIDQDSPITQPLLTAMRDNPIAIAENDSTVPDALRPRVEIATGTLSGASTAFGGGALDLTPYGMVIITATGVSHASATTNSTRINGIRVSADESSSSGAYTFMVLIDLATGVMVGIGGSSTVSAVGAVGGGASGITTATTTITITANGSNHDAGTVKIYGVK